MIISHLSKISLLLVFVFPSISPCFAHNEREHTPGNTDAIRGSAIRTEVYSRHRSDYIQPGIDFNGEGFQKGRIALESDGNVFASDDLGAIPFGIAILAKSDLLKHLVHLGYNNNPNPDRHANEAKDVPGLFQYEEYTAIVNKTAEIFKIDTTMVYDYTQPEKKINSIKNLVKEINKSSAEDPLYIIQAGAMFYLYESFAAANASKLAYVTVITHSGWNDIECYDSNKNENIIDILRDFPAVKFDYIQDQNSGLRSRGGWEHIEWLQYDSDSSLNWLYTCAQKGDPNRWGFFNLSSEVDISDAGMYYYFVTGDQYATFYKLREILSKESSNTQIKDMPADKFRVYPNPATSYINIYVDKPNYRIEVFNTQGQKVFEKKACNGKESIAAKNFGSPGVYLLKVNNTFQKVFVE